MKKLLLLCLLIAAQCSQAQLSQNLFHLRELSKHSPLKALRLAQHLQNRYPQEEALSLWLQDLAKDVKHLPQQYLQLPSPGLSSMAFHAPSQLLYTLSADGYLRAWNLSSKQAQYQSPALFEASDPQATWSKMPRSKICLQGQYLALFTQDSTQIWSLDLQTHYTCRSSLRIMSS